MNAALTCTVTPDNTLAVTLAGDWVLDAGLPGIEPVLECLQGTPLPAVMAFDTADLGDWDTGLIARLVSIRQSADTVGVPLPGAARYSAKLGRRGTGTRKRQATAGASWTGSD